MIPLSQWLCGTDSPPQDISFSAIAAPDAPGHEALLEDAYQRGRHDCLNDWNLREQSLREEHSDALAEQEARLNERWASHSAAMIAASADEAFQRLRGMLEKSICAVLLPFMQEASAAHASQGLLELLSGEFARNAGQILEIRAPAALHAPLVRLLEDRGIAAALTDSDVIEIVARDERSRFESMASRWAELLSESET
jgi:hypothetical protein